MDNHRPDIKGIITLTNVQGFLGIARGITLCLILASLILLISQWDSVPNYDPLLAALIIGITFKAIWPNAQWHSSGAKFSGKTILEFSVMILGASIFLPNVIRAGSGLVALIIFGVAGGMLVAFIVGHKILKLSPKLAILIGTSNSICGNSAAAVMAPIIGASSSELAAVIAVSGLLGAGQILLLPMLAPLFGLNNYEYGIVAGMSVYAVAQVYAASATVSATSASVATFVKLARVVLLAPLVLVIQIILSIQKTQALNEVKTFKEISIRQYLPWFVLGFILLAILRSIGFITEDQGGQIRNFSRYSFIVAMVAIGMAVDIRDVVKIGPKVVLVICSILLFMITTSVLASKILHSASVING
ncbi:MAG: putative sulfate exporter family transporter [SAR202 cluster bacterium]|nr:putative sulfate exporter family transporter [SAR202 cluster bacterium]